MLARRKQLASVPLDADFPVKRMIAQKNGRVKRSAIEKDRVMFSLAWLVNEEEGGR